MNSKFVTLQGSAEKITIWLNKNRAYFNVYVQSMLPATRPGLYLCLILMEEIMEYKTEPVEIRSDDGNVSYSYTSNIKQPKRQLPKPALILVD